MDMHASATWSDSGSGIVGVTADLDLWLGGGRVFYETTNADYSEADSVSLHAIEAGSGLGLRFGAVWTDVDGQAATDPATPQAGDTL